MDTIISTKEQLLEHLDILKFAWENEFTNLIEFSEEEIERWLVRYINQNDEVDDTFHQLGTYLREMENDLLEINTRNDIMMAPMNEYI
jgi:hypothetical protein